jgi:hypothetical protein
VVFRTPAGLRSSAENPDQRAPLTVAARLPAPIRSRGRICKRRAESCFALALLCSRPLDAQQTPQVEHGVLNYTVNGVAVSKSVQRQTLVYDDYNGTFGGTYVVEAYNCTNPANNGKNAFVTVFNVVQSNSALNVSALITLSSGLGARTCNFNGTFSQFGRMANSVSTYSCTTGEAGTLAFIEMTRERIGILGRVIGTNNFGCSLRGNFAVLD